MKKYYSTFLFIAFIQLCTSQSPYSFTYSTSPYQDLTNAVVVADTITWSPSFERVNIPLGFNFTIFDNTISSMGLFTLDGSLSAPNELDVIQIADAMYFNRATILSGQISSLKHKTEGTLNNRICKIEMNNFGLMQGNQSDYVNMQVWLYEGTNAIELRYGSSSIQDPDAVFPYTGPFVFISYSGSNPDYYGCSLLGSSTNPTFIHSPHSNGLNSFPASGTVYRFSWTPTAIHDIESNASIKLFPNPASDKIFITTEQSIETIEIYNLLGEIVMQQKAEAKNTQIDISRLPAGIYAARLKGENYEVVKKFVKE